jgi:predicted TPR repeat methyltransferase
MSGSSDGNELNEAKEVRTTVEEAVAMAIQYHQHNDFERAAYIYRTILDAVPDQPESLNFLGVLLHQTGNSDEGAQLIQKAIEVSPDYADAVSNRGNIHRFQGEYSEAEACYRRVLELDPEHGDSLNNLGVVLKNQRKLSEAESVLRHAVELHPNRPYVHFNFGNVLEHLGDREAATKEFRRAIQLKPDLRDAYDALGRSLARQKRRDEALCVYRELLEYSPGDPVAQHMLAAMGGEAMPQRASSDYVTTTFDGFADTFDTILRHLDYRAPSLVVERMERAGLKPAGILDVLDAGCGTGLCGPKLRPFARQLIGVDLSGKMLAKAKARKAYDELIQGDIVECLRERPNSIDVAVSADTLIYFGELQEVLTAAWNALRSGGYLIFTLEDLIHPGSDDYVLEIHGRYAHRESYVRRILEQVGFRDLDIGRTELRKELEESVLGQVVFARKEA